MVYILILLFQVKVLIDWFLATMQADVTIMKAALGKICIFSYEYYL